MNPEEKYMKIFRTLMKNFRNERKERFFPFYLVFSGHKNHPRFDESLSIAKYFLENAFIDSAKSEQFYRFLENDLKNYNIEKIDYWKYSDKTPLPLQDYLKVVYDLPDDCTV